MESPADLTFAQRRSLWHQLAVAISTVALVVALAIKVPHFSSNAPGWFGFTAEQIAAKSLVRDLYALPAPSLFAAGPLRPVLFSLGDPTERFATYASNKLALYDRPPPDRIRLGTSA
jgi:hypothetical protein